MILHEVQTMRGAVLALLSLAPLACGLARRENFCDDLAGASVCEGSSVETAICCPFGGYFLCEPDGSLYQVFCDPGTSCAEQNNVSFEPSAPVCTPNS